MFFASDEKGNANKAFTIALIKRYFLKFPYASLSVHKEIKINGPKLNGNSLNLYEFGLL
jgi:hypothetical protein